MIDVKDRVPTRAGRMKITHEDGTVEYIVLERADEPVQEGTPINKVLFDSIDADIKNKGTYHHEILTTQEYQHVSSDSWAECVKSEKFSFRASPSRFYLASTHLIDYRNSAAKEIKNTFLIDTEKVIVVPLNKDSEIIYTGTDFNESTPNAYKIVEYSSETVMVAFVGINENTFKMQLGIDSSSTGNTTYSATIELEVSELLANREG